MFFLICCMCKVKWHGKFKETTRALKFRGDPGRVTHVKFKDNVTDSCFRNMYVSVRRKVVDVKAVRKIMCNR